MYVNNHFVKLSVASAFPTQALWDADITNELTRFTSTHCVAMTITKVFCSHIILQKSSVVPGNGPCVAMYARGWLYPCAKEHKPQFRGEDSRQNEPESSNKSGMFVLTKRPAFMLCSAEKEGGKVMGVKELKSRGKNIRNFDFV